MLLPLLPRQLRQLGARHVLGHHALVTDLGPAAVHRQPVDGFVAATAGRPRRYRRPAANRETWQPPRRHQHAALLRGRRPLRRVLAPPPRRRHRRRRRRRRHCPGSGPGGRPYNGKRAMESTQSRVAQPSGGDRIIGSPLSSRSSSSLEDDRVGAGTPVLHGQIRRRGSGLEEERASSPHTRSPRSRRRRLIVSTAMSRDARSRRTWSRSGRRPAGETAEGEVPAYRLGGGAAARVSAAHSSIRGVAELERRRGRNLQPSHGQKRSSPEFELDAVQEEEDAGAGVRRWPGSGYQEGVPCRGAGRLRLWGATDARRRGAIAHAGQATPVPRWRLPPVFFLTPRSSRRGPMRLLSLKKAERAMTAMLDHADDSGHV